LADATAIDPSSPLYLAAAGYALAQLALGAYGAYRWSVLAQFARLRTRRPRPVRPPLGHDGAVPDADLPFVTVQLPVHDERHVVERLVDAACALDWPLDRLEVQVLDDSTDETTALARHRAALARARGVQAVVLHRARRDGFKAGALAHGLAHARGSLVCVFDADFVPPPDFLRQVVGEFADPRVGMVQARWGHLNRDGSALTRAQAIFLDAHFSIEQAARAGHGRFFNFNGTAGVWRRACIVDAGGWTHDTLTEDLDLSYRAQMKGWRFVYRDDVEAPAELPPDIRAFKGQQRRWARGSLQTARKILPRLFASPAPLVIKLEALGHLTCNVSYPLLVLSLLCLGPALVLPDTMPRWWSLTALSLLFAAGMGGVAVFFLAAQRARGVAPREAWTRLPAALLLGVGMSWTNGRAVVEAFLPGIGGWERTAKEGVTDHAAARPRARYRPARRDRGGGEASMAALAVGLTGLAMARGQWGAVAFLLFIAAGFGWVSWLTWRAGRADRELGRRAMRTARPRASRAAALLTTTKQ
jgi:hypothetical protein